MVQSPARRGRVTRDALLEEAVRFVQERGVAGWSLRELAASCGTTHGHLLYHFQSRERLLVDVMLEIRRRFNLDITPGTAGLDLSEEVLRVFAALADPALEPMRTFFYVAGLALQDPSLADFFTGMISSWVDVPGATEEERVRRRVALAAMRGLLLDLLVTEDREGVQAALEELSTMLHRTAPRRRMRS